MAIAQFKDLCIDAVDPARLGVFWAAALGLTWQAKDDGATSFSNYHCSPVRTARQLGIPAANARRRSQGI